MIHDSGKNIKEGVNCEFVVDCYSTESIDESSAMEFKIYPNPAQDVINIDSNIQKYEYQLINNIGQVVMRGMLSGENTISVENLNNGIYFLKLIAEGEVSVNKVIIQ